MDAGAVGIMALLVLMAVLVFVVAITGVKIVSPYEKGVVERLGR